MTQSNEDAPAKDLVAPTKHDSDNDPNGPFRAIYCGGSGDVKITTLAGTDVTIVDLAAGVLHPIGCKRIWSTGTTATDLLAVPVNDHGPY